MFSLFCLKFSNIKFITYSRFLFRLTLMSVYFISFRVIFFVVPIHFGWFHSFWFVPSFRFIYSWSFDFVSGRFIIILSFELVSDFFLSYEFVDIFIFSYFWNSSVRLWVCLFEYILFCFLPKQYFLFHLQRILM